MTTTGYHIEHLSVSVAKEQISKYKKNFHVHKRAITLLSVPFRATTIQLLRSSGNFMRVRSLGRASDSQVNAARLGSVR